MATTTSINPLDVDPNEDQRKHESIDAFCRLCLSEPLTLIPLRAVIGDVSIPVMFHALTGVQIDLDAPYPKRLCSVCLEKLETAYGIRKEFLDNVATLESYFRVAAPPDGGFVVIKEECVEQEIVVKQEEMEDDAPPEFKMRDSFEGEGDSSGSEYMPEYVDVAESVEQLERQKPGRKKVGRRRKLQIIGEPSVMDPLKCYICEGQFVDERELNVHLPQHANLLPYTCEPCVTGGGLTKKIITVVMLHRHFQMHAGTIECPLCPMRVYNEDRLYAHVKRYHSEQSRTKFTCEKCGYQLTSKESYQSHMVRHEAVEEGRYACSICDKKFGTRARLKRHLLTHVENQEYQCQYCSKYISSKTLLLTHEREHVDAGDLKQYACAFCNERFANRSAQMKHVSAEHPEMVERRHTGGRKTCEIVKGVGYQRTRESLKCTFEGCEFVAKCNASFYNHKNLHGNRFKCSVCEKVFANRQQLNIHANTHLGKTERPFACDQCDRKFASKARMNGHRRIHTGVRPYLCTECGESFTTSARLANHVLKHSAPQHKCLVCSKEFRYKGDYVRHAKKHEEEEGVVSETVL
uniref:Putative adult enhancer factor 1 n=1 Tax=Culex tarsalis TaxID=7177 RepID=A0A1Q3F0E3_CULTA